VNTLFLYIDILGFSELVKEPAKVRRLFRMLDEARIHLDSNYQSIAFSDTIVAYNRHRGLSGQAKTTELMFLIELTQELFLKLAGSGTFFRAVITEGEFFHEKMKHMDAFFGQALVDTYRAEKQLVGLGLFLDVDLRPFNQVFRWSEFSSKYDFVYLTHYCTHLCPRRADLFDSNDPMSDAQFPLPGEILDASGLQHMIYPEILHLQEVRSTMDHHPNPSVRAKHLATWQMYKKEYSRLIQSLENHGMEPDGVATLDWRSVKQQFYDQKRA
jgi:hypothetical protein